LKVARKKGTPAYDGAIKNVGPAYAGPSELRLPKSSVMIAYFFFEDFLPPAFLPPAFFFAAISAHHLSCRTGPLGRALGIASLDRSSKLCKRV
jgi:hypothetical protein